MVESEQPKMIIRDRRDEDTEVIVSLALESLRWHAETFSHIRPAPPRDSLLSDFRELAATPDTYFRVAELDATVVGFLTAGLHPPTSGGIEALDEPSVYISDVVVTSSARRRGIARALLADLDVWASQRECHTIRLTMHAGNEPAHHLYDQLGYRPSWIAFRKDTASQTATTGLG